MGSRSSLTFLGGMMLAAVAGTAAAADIPTDDNGNRYDKPRYYTSEVSVAQAYAEMMRREAVVIDVRTRREYAAGHPTRAYNVPYPRIDGGYTQDPAVFYWEVYDIVHGKTDTPIATLCRTGSRSVDAANILADPQNHGVPDGIPFTNVRNIWEGFVGQHLYAFIGGVPDPTLPLDLNNDGLINGDAAVVYAHTADANPDKDGWRNFAGLEWTTEIRKPLAYQRNVQQYWCWQNDVGCP